MATNLVIGSRRRKILNAIHIGDVVKAGGAIVWNGRDISDEFTPLQSAGYAGIGVGVSRSYQTPRPVKLTDKGRAAIGVEADDLD